MLTNLIDKVQGNFKLRRQEKVASKIVALRTGSERLFYFFADMRNFNQMQHNPKVQKWVAREDYISFHTRPIGDILIRQVESQPFDLLKYEVRRPPVFNFTVWIQIKEVQYYDSRIKITIRSDSNRFVRFLMNPSLKRTADQMASQIAQNMQA